MSEARHGIEWRRISRGLFWIGIGVLLLLNTSGNVSWSVWIEALTLWPVLLVALGLRLIFEHSRAPVLVLLSPLLILGVLGWLAFKGPGDPVHRWTDIRADGQGTPDAWLLEADLAFADLGVRTDALEAPLLARGRAAPGKHGLLRVGGPVERPRVRIGRRDRDWTIFTPALREYWELDVTDRLPMTVDLELAFTRGTVALERAPVRRIDIEGAFNSLELRLGALDADDDDVRIYLDGAFNESVLVVPPSTPVTVRTEGLMTRFRSRRDSRPTGGPGYRVYLDGAFSRLDVRSGP